MTLRLIVSLVVLALAAFCVGCDGTSAQSSAAGSGKIQATCTVAMVGDVVAAVGGDQVEVTTLIGTGVDPHLYRPTRDDLRQLQSAQIVFYSGYHLEGKMAETLEQLNRSKPSIAVAERSGQGLKADDTGDAHDPHVWMDPGRWQHIAAVVADELTKLRPEHKAGFDARAAAFRERAMALQTYGQRIVQTVPQEKRVLVTSHDAFRYFGKAYGIRELSLQGISTESEASLRKINDVAAEVVRLKVPAVFIESSVPAKSVQALIDACASQGHRVVVGGELFSDAMGAPGTYEGTYIGMIDHNLTLIVRALGGQAPERGMDGKLAPHAAHQ